MKKNPENVALLDGAPPTTSMDAAARELPPCDGSLDSIAARIANIHTSLASGPLSQAEYAIRTERYGQSKKVIEQQQNRAADEARHPGQDAAAVARRKEQFERQVAALEGEKPGPFSLGARRDFVVGTLLPAKKWLQEVQPRIRADLAPLVELQRKGRLDPSFGHALDDLTAAESQIRELLFGELLRIEAELETLLPPSIAAALAALRRIVSALSPLTDGPEPITRGLAECLRKARAELATIEQAVTGATWAELVTLSKKYPQ